MIIPICCFTCGKQIAHLWESYLKQINEEYNKGIKKNKNIILERNIIEQIKNDNGSIEKRVLDKMNLRRYCCRRMMLSNVDLCNKI